MYGGNFPNYPAQGQPPYFAQQQSHSDSGLENVTGMLKHMDKDDLQKLLESDEKIAELIDSCRDLQQLKQDKLDTMGSNRSLAEYNLSYKPRIESGKVELISLSERAVALRSALATSVSKLDNLNSDATSDTLVTLLESASMESEEMSEELLDSLNSGSIGLAEFIQKYSEARQTYHLRKIKAEKLTELSNRQYAQPRRQPQATQPGWNPPPPPPPLPQAYGYGAPYQYQ